MAKTQQEASEQAHRVHPTLSEPINAIVIKTTHMNRQWDLNFGFRFDPTGKITVGTKINDGGGFFSEVLEVITPQPA